MPFITRNVCHTHANLPISLWSTISLTFALFYLQVIYAVSFVARPFWSSNLDFPPFRQAIESAEKFTIDIILEIVPTSQYRSPAPTALNEDTIDRRLAFGIDRSTSAPGTSARVVASGSVHLVPPKMPQCFPEPQTSPMSPNQKETRTETMRSTHTERVTKAGNSGASIYGTAQKMPKSARTPLSTTFEAHQHHDNPPKDSGVTNTTVTKEEEHQEEEVTVHTIEISQTADPTLDISHPTAPVMDMPRPSIPTEQSPTDSFDGPGEFAPESGPLSSSSRYTDNTSSLSLDATRGAKSHSTESYPGKFPVSEGVEYSSLATAGFAFRERGTTSVRPFSDY